jgi:outer membrane protein assembly factor BamB
VEDTVLQNKGLIMGITALFLLTLFSPLSVGWNITLDDESLDDSDFIDDNINFLTWHPPNLNRIRDTFFNMDSLDSADYKTFTLTPLNKSNMQVAPWPMHCHDRNHTGLSPYPTADNPGVEKWRLKTQGSSVWTGIAIDTNGILYFGDFSGYLYAVYPNGTIKWQYKMGLITTSTPYVADDGVIYIGGFDDKLHAVYPNGTRKWAVNIGGDISSSPAVGDDGTIYIGTMTPDNSMVAVNHNGTIKWKLQTGFFVTSDPTVTADGTIIFGSADKHVYALYPNGTVRWQFRACGWVKGSASIDSNGIIYIGAWESAGGNGGYVYALYPNGTVKWNASIGGGTESNPSFGPDGTIYVSNSRLWALDPVDGSVKWTFQYLTDNEVATLSNPAVSSDGIIYIGTEIDEVKGGQIYAINPDGSIRWRKMIANENIVSSPSIDRDGSIYIGSQSHSLTYPFGCIHAFNEITSNQPPYPPEFVGNLIKWAVGENIYKFRGYDPDNNPLQFFIDWGNGRTTGWTHECAPGEILEIPFIYITPGRHYIKFKTRDVLGEESEWTHVTVRLPYTYNGPMQWLDERFPLMAWFLNLFKN